MGTFFTPCLVKDLGMTAEDFFRGSAERIYPKPETPVANWFEFGQAIGFNHKISDENFSIHITTSYDSQNNDVPPKPILRSFENISRKINIALSEYIAFLLRDDEYVSEAVMSGLTVPKINHEALRDFGARTLSNADLIGTFLIELKEEIPELVASLPLSARQEFEMGVKAYIDYESEAARIRLERAQQKSEEARKTEEEADQITEEAHRKTDAALGAEATAEGLQRLTDHWQQKALHHQVRRGSNFVLFSAVLVLALAVLLLSQAGIIQSTLNHWCGDTPYCPSSWQQYWKNTAFTANGSWVWALLSLKGFLLPVLGVAWLLRILSRQNATHFALENDARQRLALLVSFVRLQELPETQLSEAERLLILNALFRPADATPSDAPPPNLTELLTKLKP